MIGLVLEVAIWIVVETVSATWPFYLTIFMVLGLMSLGGLGVAVLGSLGYWLLDGLPSREG